MKNLQTALKELKFKKILRPEAIKGGEGGPVIEKKKLKSKNK